MLAGFRGAAGYARRRGAGKSSSAGKSTAVAPEMREVVVSWASAAQSTNPRAHLRVDCHFGKTVPAIQRTYTVGLNGQTVFTYSRGAW